MSFSIPRLLIYKMGSVMANVSVLVLLLCCGFTVFEAAAYHGSPAPAPSPANHHGHHPVAAPSHHQHHHHHSPSPSPSPHHHPYAPASSPVYPPPSPVHKAPVQPPKPSSYIPRSFVEVQGVVYCKSCKYSGVDTLIGAKPLYGATVKVSCKNTKYAPAVETATTDKNGYFRVAAPKNVTSYAFHRCKVYLVESPDASCKNPSNLNGGVDGGDLKPARAFTDAEKKPVVLYNVGPLAFEPTCAR